MYNYVYALPLRVHCMHVHMPVLLICVLYTVFIMAPLVSYYIGVFVRSQV